MHRGYPASPDKWGRPRRPQRIAGSPFGVVAACWQFIHHVDGTGRGTGPAVAALTAKSCRTSGSSHPNARIRHLAIQAGGVIWAGATVLGW
jgi:hypothetical protein